MPEPIDRPQLVGFRVVGHVSRTRMILLAAIIIAAGGALLTVGFLLLLLLAAAGAVAGTAWLLVHRVRRFFGRARTAVTQREHGRMVASWHDVGDPGEVRLDPAMEIAVIEAEPSLTSPPDFDRRPSRDTAPDRRP